jgi:Cu-Zn family superoxide dismutase
MSRIRLAVLALLTGALLALGLTGVAQAGSTTHERPGDGTVVYTLDPSTHGNPEGIAWDERSQSFFVGTVGDGTIYHGRLGDRTVRPYIPGGPGQVAVGMKTFRGKLYVAGGPTGHITVYNIRTKAVVGSFNTGTGGFLNDLVVTARGDVYVTDSFRPILWHVTAAQVRAGSGKPEAISLAPEIEYQAGAFNLNGIVAFRGGRELVTVDTATGQLWRIKLHRYARNARVISLIKAPPLVGGDGMIVDHGKLVVVIGNPATLNFVRLNHDHTRGGRVGVRTDPTLRGPSTVARAHNRYLVVNADFATSTKPFTVSGLLRHRDD